MQGDPPTLYKLRAGTGSHMDARVCPHREHGALGFHREALDPSLPTQPRRLHIPCLRLSHSPQHPARCSLDRALVSVELVSVLRLVGCLP